MTRTTHRALATTVVLVLAVSAGGCVSAVELALPALVPGTVAADAARPERGGATFAGLSLRERREQVFARLADEGRHADAAGCTFARLAPIDGSRRAFPLERCEHGAVGDDREVDVLAGYPVRSLVTHFVDARLARVDAVVAPADIRDGDAGGGAPRERRASVLESVGARLDARLGMRVPRRDEGVDRWALGDDVVELVDTSSGAVRLSVIDGAALAMLPALGEDDPTATSD